MGFDADIHHRRSIRFKGYNYSQQGAYFVIICVQNRECLFGRVVNGRVELNQAGKMVSKWFSKLTGRFLPVQIDSFIVMPNHFHGIISIVGADPCVCPSVHGQNGVRVWRKGAHMGAPLQKIIQWFKTMTTNEYVRQVKNSMWPPFPGRLWQRNYYEHIIRDENDYLRITKYIQANPTNWDTDEENPLN